MRKTLFLLSLLLLAFGIWSCENSTAEPDSIAPTGLTYSPNSYNVTVGQAGSSAVPTITGTAPFTYELVANTNAAISINASTGQISSTAALATGSYTLSVKVTNAAGNRTFNNALTINMSVPNQPPTALNYTKNAITIRKHESIETGAPIVQGTAPFSFSITNSGSLPAGITINASTGNITLPKNLAHGSYTIDVKVTNALGEQSKTSAVSVSSVAVVFSGSGGMLSLVQGKCAPCHVSGGLNPNYSVYNNAKNSVDNIISRVESGSMPQGGAKLPDSEIALIKQWKADGLKEN